MAWRGLLRLHSQLVWVLQQHWLLLLLLRKLVLVHLLLLKLLKL
jgi:hypothetical protein